MGGNTLAEGDETGNSTAEYIYFGGKRVARINLPANTVHFICQTIWAQPALWPVRQARLKRDRTIIHLELRPLLQAVNELKFYG